MCFMLVGFLYSIFLPSCATKGFVLLVLLSSWLTTLDGGEGTREIEFLELFAGQARITRLAKKLGIPADAHDWDYDVGAKQSSGTKRNSMDITGSAGIVTLSGHLQNVFGTKPLEVMYNC